MIEFVYDTSLMGDGAVIVRNGIRLGKSLTKKELAKGKLEEA
jgi:hypothetical protein